MQATSTAMGLHNESPAAPSGTITDPHDLEYPPESWRSSGAWSLYSIDDSYFKYEDESHYDYQMRTAAENEAQFERLVSPIELEALPKPLRPISKALPRLPTRSNTVLSRAISKPSADEDDVELPSGVRLGLMVTSLCLCVSLIALDSTIVSTAIPTLVHNWDSMNDIGWYGAAYLLPQPALQPSVGKLYPYLNTKYACLSGLFIFEAGSLLCALSNSSLMFILSRTLAGIGAAIVAPGVLLIVTDTISKPKRPLFIGLAAAVAGMAACLGPFVGGQFTEKVTWRWCFYINLPLGYAAGTFLGILYKPIPRQVEPLPWMTILKRLDPLGCTLLTSAVVSLMVGFTFAAEDGWSSAKVIALLSLFGALMVALAVEQWYAKDEFALLPKKMLRKRGIVLCSVYGFLIEMGSTAHIFYLPFYFQGARGASPGQSGVDLLPYLVSQTLAGLATGIFITVVGSYNHPMILGSEIFSVGAGLLMTLSVMTPTKVWIGFQVLAGFGTGVSQFLATGIAQQLLDRDEESIGLSMVFMIKTLGSAVSVSLCSTLFNSRLPDHLADFKLPAQQVAAVLRLISGAPTSSDGSGSGKGGGKNGGTSPGMAAKLKEMAAIAVAKSVDDVFLVALATGLAAFVIAFMTERVRVDKKPSQLRKEKSEQQQKKSSSADGVRV